MKKHSDFPELVLVIIPVAPSSNDKLEGAKIASRHSQAYASGWDNVFGARDPKKNANLPN